MNKKNGLLFLFLIIVSIGSLKAQETNELKKEINQIKKSSLYLYGETTVADKEEAMAIAMDILQNEAVKWVTNKKKKKELNQDIILTNIGQFANRVELPRGNMFRAFVYVKKSDILTSSNTVVASVNESDDNGEYNAAETVEEAQVLSEVPEVVKLLLTIKKYEDLPPCLENLKKENKISEYKRYALLSDPNEYILIIYNRAAEIEAILSDGKDRINFRTNKPDGIVNYKGRGAIGIKLTK